MKIESLTIIFIIIMLPIMLVLSEYVDNKVTIAQIEMDYNDKLFNSTYDAVKALQLNTVTNAFSDVTNSKILDLETAATTFYNSLSTNFGYTGYNSDTMKDYVPAVVFTLYDGYYIYAPYTNILTSTLENRLNLTETDASGNPTKVDPEYKSGKELEGLKSYVYYSCRYVRPVDDTDVVITYTLDNYITVQGIVKGTYVYQYGYLINGITYSNSKDSYKYDGIEFFKDSTYGTADDKSVPEILEEYIGPDKYKYVKVNGKKYYLDDKGTANSNDDDIFYIDYTGVKNYSQAAGEGNELKKAAYLKAISENKSAYEYYRNACNFTTWVNDNLSDLRTSDAVTSAKTIGDSGNVVDDDSENLIKLSDVYGDFKIFDGGDYQKATSAFNQHRMSVIRYSVETNLSTAISAFSSKVSSTERFIMPKISDTDWDIIENDICTIAFVQGMPLANKRYNSYSVVANTLTKEYIDEDDIYIADENGIYYTVTDKTLKDASKVNLSNSKGYDKIDFEMKSYVDTTGEKKYYYSVCNNSKLPYKGSYTSIFGDTGIDSSSIIKTVASPDMYTYIENCGNTTLKKLYYTALGRERWGSYHVNNDIDNRDFLKDYY